MKLSKLFFLALMGLTMAFVSCSGEDGEQGPRGEQGQPGDKGDPGTPGDSGADGSANAIQYFIQFEEDPGGKSSFEFDIPQITQDVLNDDTILFYFNVSVGDDIFHYLVPGLNHDGTFLVGANTEVGKVTFFCKDFDGNDFNLPVNQLLGIKMIIIESSNTGNNVNISTKSGQSKDNILVYLKTVGIDVNDYDALTAHFNL